MPPPTTIDVEVWIVGASAAEVQLAATALRERAGYASLRFAEQPEPPSAGRSGWSLYGVFECPSPLPPERSAAHSGGRR